MNLKFLFGIASSGLTIEDLLNNQIVEGTSSGSVTLPGTGFRPGELSDSIEIYSFDNANTLRGIKDIIVNGMNVETGERLYLEAVFRHNGYPESINSLELGDFADYLFSFKEMTSTELTSLVSTTFNPRVKELLVHAESVGPEN